MTITTVILHERDFTVYQFVKHYVRFGALVETCINEDITESPDVILYNMITPDAEFRRLSFRLSAKSKAEKPLLLYVLAAISLATQMHSIVVSKMPSQNPTN